MTERERAIELQQRLMAELYAKRAQDYGDYCKEVGDKAEPFGEWVERTNRNIINFPGDD